MNADRGTTRVRARMHGVVLGTAGSIQPHGHCASEIAGKEMNMSQQRQNVDVWMLHTNIHRSPVYPLPGGYRLRFYKSGDVSVWVAIQQQSDPFFTATEATFVQYLPDSDRWSERVMFLVDPLGTDVGTITAWNDNKLTGSEMGLVHWLAILPQAQGKGLAKPLLGACLGLMQQLGYTGAYLETGSARLTAINLYLHFGFKAFTKGEVDTSAWRIIAPQLKYSIE
jgi:GNAT superfamily N-acetyltransferase